MGFLIDGICEICSSMNILRCNTMTRSRIHTLTQYEYSAVNVYFGNTATWALIPRPFRILMMSQISIGVMMMVMMMLLLFRRLRRVHRCRVADH